MATWYKTIIEWMRARERQRDVPLSAAESRAWAAMLARIREAARARSLEVSEPG